MLSRGFSCSVSSNQTIRCLTTSGVLSLVPNAKNCVVASRGYRDVPKVAVLMTDGAGRITKEMELLGILEQCDSLKPCVRYHSERLRAGGLRRGLLLIDDLEIVLVVTHHIYSRFSGFPQVPCDTGNAQNCSYTLTSLN